MAKLADLSDSEPRVLKEEEYEQFVEFVNHGVWKNNVWIASLIGVNEETIASWKKTARVREARRLRSSSELEKWGKQGRVEDRLKELGMEFENPTVNVNAYYQSFTDEQLTELANEKARRLGLLGDSAGD